MQLAVILGERRPVHRHLVVVLQKMLIVDERLRMLFADGRGEKLFGQDDAGSLPFLSAVTAEADLLEAVTGRDDPCIVHRSREAAAKVFEDRGVAGRLRDEVVKRLVATGDNASRGDVVAEN